MLTYLKTLFRKKFGAPTPAHVPLVIPRPTSEAPVAMPRVETASLQLLAIMAKFPEDLRQLVKKLPPPEAMVALPLPTILKYLPSGSVKMSLASVVRQAPAGTFDTTHAPEKRAVEVPLAEIFKRVSPAILKKRNDQRYTDLAEEGFDIFGDDENPHALAPRVMDRPAASAPKSSALFPATRTLRMPTPVPASTPTREVAVAKLAAPALSKIVAPAKAAAPVIALKVSPPAAPAPTESSPVSDGPPLVLPLNDLAAGWPEPIKTEAAALNGATVALPAGDVGAGLKKGKIAFQWGQIRAWLTPPAQSPTAANEATELPLPLRVIAPAFLKHTKAGGKSEPAKPKPDLDESIPALFSGPRTAPAPAPEPAKVEAPVAEIQPAAPEAELKIAATPEPTAAVEEKPAAPAAKAAPSKKSAPAAKAAPAPAPVVEAAPVAPPEPQSLSELFNEPDKKSWSPNELVASLLGKIPQVDGAIVALQEGLVVAAQLPEAFKGDVFAAFLPQMFARINQYSGEMKLGAVDNLTLSAGGRQCQFFRTGQVYFGVLAKPNETLPARALQLCAASLAE